MPHISCEVMGCVLRTEEHITDGAAQVTRLGLHVSTAHVAGAAQTKPGNLPRPAIGLDETTETLGDFELAWTQYKEEYKLVGAAATRQLFACCSKELATGVLRTTGGGQFKITEAELMNHVKKLSVQYQNPTEFVQQFLSMSQQPDEGVQHYLARLKGAANRCQFEVKCTCDLSVSYADNVTRFKLIAGLTDGEIKEDLLGMEDKSLEDTVKFVESKESGKRAKGVVGGNTPAKVGSVSTPTGKQFKPCTHCGRKNHGSSREEREKLCPDYSKSCNNCAGSGHFKTSV